MIISIAILFRRQDGSLGISNEIRNLENYHPSVGAKDILKEKRTLLKATGATFIEANIQKMQL